MAEGMAIDVLGQAGLLGGPADGLLQGAFVDVVAAEQARLWVPGEAGGREDVLPGPFVVGVGIFAVQGKG